MNRAYASQFPEGAPTIAYYPGETPLYGGDYTVTEDAALAAEIGQPAAQVVVQDDELLAMTMTWVVQRPLRTQYAGYFLRQVGSLTVCNVDLELPIQPTLREVTGALLATMLTSQAAGV